TSSTPWTPPSCSATTTWGREVNREPAPANPARDADPAGGGRPAGGLLRPDRRGTPTQPRQAQEVPRRPPALRPAAAGHPVLPGPSRRAARPPQQARPRPARGGARRPGPPAARAGALRRLAGTPARDAAAAAQGGAHPPGTAAPARRAAR